MEFDDFIRSPRCRPFEPKDEDEIQDREVYRKKQREDQERQYEVYRKQFEPKDTEPSNEEKRVTLQLSKLRNNSGGDDGSTSDHGLPEKKPPVTLPKLTPLRNNGKSRAEYMREYRRKPKFCPHCKKQL